MKSATETPSTEPEAKGGDGSNSSRTLCSTSLQSLETVYRADYLLSGDCWIIGWERPTKKAALRDIRKWREDYGFEYEMRLTVRKVYHFYV